jgi:hypothetical protein
MPIYMEYMGDRFGRVVDSVGKYVSWPYRRVHRSGAASQKPQAGPTSLGTSGAAPQLLNTVPHTVKFDFIPLP